MSIFMQFILSNKTAFFFLFFFAHLEMLHCAHSMCICKMCILQCIVYFNQSFVAKLNFVLGCAGFGAKGHNLRLEVISRSGGIYVCAKRAKLESTLTSQKGIPLPSPSTEPARDRGNGASSVDPPIARIVLRGQKSAIGLM